MKRIYTKKNVVFYILMNVQRFIHLAFSEEVHEHWHGAAIAPTASNSGGVVRCGGGRARFFLNNTSNVLFSMCTLLLFAVLWKCCAFIYASTSLHSFGIFLSFQLHYTIVVFSAWFFFFFFVFFFYHRGTWTEHDSHRTSNIFHMQWEKRHWIKMLWVMEFPGPGERRK